MFATIKMPVTALCFERWRKLLIFSATCHSKRQAEQFTGYYTEKWVSWITVYHCRKIDDSTLVFCFFFLKVKIYFVFSWKLRENFVPLFYYVLSKHHLLAAEGERLQRMNGHLVLASIFPNVQKYFRMDIQCTPSWYLKIHILNI